MVAAVWAVAVLPVVVAAVRAIVGHWRPIGDNALVALRAHDVLTSHQPLLGTWSSASLEAGKDLNHPGPLLFESVALPVKLLGSNAGLVLGVALVNILAITAVAVFAFRRGGRTGAVVLLLGALYLEFVMGSELLFDPWNPHILILACLAMLTCAWGVAAGDRWALPVYLALGSYCVQTHLGYAYLVPGLLAAALLFRWLARRLSLIELDGFLRRREIGWSVGVVMVLWAQPMVEQFFGDGEGNLSRVIGARGSDGLKIGPSLGVRLFASVVTRPPWSARAGFTEAVPNTGYATPGVLKPIDVMGGGAAVARLTVGAVVVALLLVVAWRRRDGQGALGIATAVAALTVALGSMVIMPVGPIGLTAHQMRWLWPISVFALCTVVFAAVRAWSPERPALWAGGALAGVLALLTLPTYVQPAGPAARHDLIPVVAQLDAQLAPLEGIGTVWLDTSRTPAFDNFDASVMLELQRRGVPFVVDEPGLVRQVGDARRLHGNADVQLYLLRGREVLTVPEGADRVALVLSMSADDAAELQDLDLLVKDGGSLDAVEQARYDELLAQADQGSVAAVISPIA
ncbi:MAG: hypothetical protein RJA49_1977 [Actinomycetota bacterium]